MTRTTCPKLAASTQNPVRSREVYAPQLTVICEEPNVPDAEKQNYPSIPPQSVKTLQVLLTAEKAFLNSLRDIAQENCGHLSDFEKFQRKLHHDNVLHVARFFFLLSELDCSGPNEIKALIKGHNDQIDELVRKKDFRVRSQGELQKAKFSKYKRADCIDSIGWSKRPAFIRSEIASFLYEHMGRAAAESTVDDMVKAGLLSETTYSPEDGPDRKLVKADGRLEGAVRTYLNDIWLPIKNA